MNASVPSQSISVMHRWKWTLGLAGVSAFGLLLFFFNPETTAIYPQCLLFKTTGIQCPGCGTLRAGHSLLHGQWWSAFTYNPFLISTGVLLSGLAIADAGLRLTGRRILFLPLLKNTQVIWALIGLAILFGLVRNLPWFQS